MPIYTFWLEFEDGRRLEWNGLTQRQAIAMYQHTDKNLSIHTPVKRYGWKETT